MRPAVFAALSLAWLLACEGPQADVSPVTVLWMDWPGEVNAGQPFRTRMVVWSVCAVNPQFRAGAQADQSAVTFEPYYLIGHDQIACLTERTPTLLALIALDTAGIAPGLVAASPRTYDMRAPVTAYALSTTAVPNSVLGKFGVVTVQPTGADPLRRNAAGDVVAERDTLGCVRVRPVGLYDPGAALVLEDQADTAGLSHAFVRGFIHETATPVCGETRVFHLVTKN